MKARNLIYITGVGVISPAGVNIEESWDKMKNGQIFIDKIKSWDTSGLLTENAGEISLTDEEILNLLSNPPKSHRKMPLERGELLFFKALEEALSNANLTTKILKERKVGIFIGTLLSGFTLLEKDYTAYIKKSKKMSLKSMLVFPMNTVADRLAYEYGIKGERYVFSTACSSSLHAVFWAAEFLRAGKIELAICGGTDPLSLISLAGFSSLRSLARNTCSPFSTKDLGLSIGEGAGVCILETEDSIKRRNFNKSLCLIGGYGGTSDAYHPTASDPSGKSIVECMKSALDSLKITPENNIYIVAHGTGTPHNDLVETRAIKKALFEHNKLKVTSIKSMIGHTLGASGTVELAFLVNSLEKDEILPTANFSVPRKGCDLDYVPNRSQKYEIDLGIKNAFAFGGNNVTVSIVKNKEVLKEINSKTLSNEPIAIIGIGIVTPCGIGGEALIKALETGKSCIKSVDSIKGFIRKHSKATKAGIVEYDQIKDFCIRHHVRNFRKMDRISRLAITSAISAIEDAKIKISSSNAYKIGLIAGTATGPLESIERFYNDIVLYGPQKARAEIFPNTVVNAHLGYISIELRIKGYATVITQSNLSDIIALKIGTELLKSGKAEFVLVGASAEYTPSYHRILKDIGLYSENFKVYDKRSNGYIPSEGSGYVVLEKLDKAILENRKIYGIIKDIQINGVPTFPATDRYSENPLITLFSNSKVDLLEPQVIYSIGSGVKQRDYAELEALEKFFPNIPITTFTEYTGYIIGCSALINTIIWSLTNEKNLIFNVLNTTDPISKNVVIEKPLRKVIDRALVTGIAEGGVAGYIYLTKK